MDNKLVSVNLLFVPWCLSCHILIEYFSIWLKSISWTINYMFNIYNDTIDKYSSLSSNRLRWKRINIIFTFVPRKLWRRRGWRYGSPLNSPPVITNSSSSYSVLENQNFAFTLQGSDPDGDTVSFNIFAGEDQNCLQ